MAHLKVLKLEDSGIPGKPQAITVLPGEFKSDKEAYDSLEESGEYLFLETHHFDVAKKKGKKNSEETK